MYVLLWPFYDGCASSSKENDLYWKNGKKTNMTHTNVNQINDNNMQLVQVLMESSVYAFVQNNIWSIWWSCLLMVLLYIAEMESIWCPLMYTMTASWSVLTHSFVHANKNKRKKKTNKSISIHSQLSCLVSSIRGPVLH